MTGQIPALPAGAGEVPALFEAINTTRAVRYYKPDPVPPDYIDYLIWAATRAPNPANLQSWHFIVVTDREILKVIENEVVAVMESVHSGHDDELPDDESTARAIKGGWHLLRHLSELPVLIIVAAKAAYPPEDPSVAWVPSTIFPATQNLLLAARGLGLGATMTTLHYFAPDAFQKTLRIPEDVHVGAVIPVGWPLTDRQYGPVRRGPIEDVTHYNGW